MKVAMEALLLKASKLPRVDIERPEEGDQARLRCSPCSRARCAAMWARWPA